MRKEFELNDKDYNRLMNACKPVPYMVFGGRFPPSLQERVNSAWKALGDKLGFQYMTVEPVSDKSDRFFTAEEKESK
jgi:hypothetical protein